MTKANLSLACGSYDRVRPLFDGEVKPEGINLTCIALPPTELFRRMIKFGEFDVAEMSLVLYSIQRLRRKSFIAIPVFPFRAFHHLGILCNSKSGIEKPKDIEGKKFGIPEYQMSAAVWTRGILKDDFDVSWKKIKWFVGQSGANASHAGELGIKPPPGVSVSGIPRKSELGSMLINGEIDVMLSTAQSTLPSLPDSSHRKDLWGDSHVRKLFTKPLDEAKRYYAKSGFIPVNHTIVIKQQIVKNHPWVPLTLLKAFEESKKISLNRINRLVQSNLVEARVIIDEQRRIFGEDPFPYGFEQNRAPLDTLSRYLIDQSLIPEPFSWEEHFADTTLES